MKRFVVLLPFLALIACSQQVSTTQSSTIQVAASFYPIAYMAQKIGNGFVDVAQITPGGVEPHDYEPTPQDLVVVHQAKVFLMNGEGVDAWGDKVIDELKQNGVITVRMSDTITPLGGFNEGGEQDPTKPSSANANAFDPHIWLDPVNGEKEVALIRDALIKADSSHAVQYAANAAALISRLSDLDQSYRIGLAHCSIHNIVTSHNAFRYLAKEYGFTSYAIAGLSPDQEPSAKRLAELADLAKREHIEYIFFETLVSPKLADTVATEIGAKSLVLNPIEGLTPTDIAQGKNYVNILQENLQNLRTAMKCQ